MAPRSARSRPSRAALGPTSKALLHLLGTAMAPEKPGAARAYLEALREAKKEL